MSKPKNPKSCHPCNDRGYGCPTGVTCAAVATAFALLAVLLTGTRFATASPGSVSLFAHLADSDLSSHSCESRGLPYPRHAPGISPSGPTRPAGPLARGKFLVASDGLKDSNFSQTVVLLIEYGPTGAMGVVINRPTDIALSSIFPKIQELKERTDVVFVGGPVARHRILLLVRSADQPQGSRPVFEDVYLSASFDTLRHMISREGPSERFHAYAGYAGWAPGQLDREAARGDWLVADADAETVFDKAPADVWPELLGRNSGQWASVTLTSQP